MKVASNVVNHHTNAMSEEAKGETQKMMNVLEWMRMEKWNNNPGYAGRPIQFSFALAIVLDALAQLTCSILSQLHWKGPI